MDTRSPFSARFVPLPTSSQGCSESVLYIDTQASIESLLEAASARSDAVHRLLESLYEFSHAPHEGLSIVSITVSYLLSDVAMLLDVCHKKVTYKKGHQ